MTREEFDIITNKIGCWFTRLKLNSFRKTFDGEIYPSSALGTDYRLFIYKLEKELSFEDKPSLPSNLDEAANNLVNGRVFTWHHSDISPSTSTIEFHGESLMECSAAVDSRHRCDSNCSLYHICRDRHYGDFCSDKRYQG